MSPFSLGVLGSAHVPAAGGGTLALTYVGTVSSAADGTSYTFTAADIGTASSDRTLIIAAMGRGSAQATSVAVSVGGTVATEDVSISYSQNVCGLWRIPYPSGSTADITVTFSHTRWGAAAHVYAITGATVAKNDSDSIGPFQETSSGWLTIDATAGGAVIAASLYHTTSGDATWTGVTEDYDATYGSALKGSGGHTHTPTTGPVTVDIDTTVVYLPTLVAVSYVAA